MLYKKVANRLVHCSCITVCECLWANGTREKGECVMKTRRETVSDFSSSSVLSPGSPAVANSQFDTSAKHGMHTNTDTHTHTHTQTVIGNYTNRRILIPEYSGNHLTGQYGPRLRECEHPEGQKWGDRLVHWFFILRSTGRTKLRSTAAGEGIFHRELDPHTGFCLRTALILSRGMFQYNLEVFEGLHCKICLPDSSMQVCLFHLLSLRQSHRAWKYLLPAM